MNSTRLLIVLLGSLGDVVRGLALVRVLRSARPDWFLAWLVEPRWAPLVQAHPDLNQAIIFDRSRGVRAVLRDPQERGPVVLTTTGGGPERTLAVLRLVGREEPVVLGEGATAQAGGWSFGVERIRAVPESVEVSRTAADTGAATVRWLQVSKR